MNATQQATIHRIPVSNVYTDIQTFLGQYKSINTKKQYTAHIEEYFQFMYSKQLNELSKDDIEYVYNDKNEKEELLMKHVDSYKNHLRKKHTNSDSTIMKKLSAIRSLYNYLSINGYKINPNVVNMKFLKNNPNSYDSLPWYLVTPFSEKALSLPEVSHAGEELSVFILVSAQTSFRVSALLSLRMRNIKFDHESGFYEMSLLDKGDKRRKQPITTEVYERIVALNKKDKVFEKLKVDWINKAIKKIASTFEELNGKLIVTHSLRKSAPAYEWKTTKDINAVCEQTGHASREVALKTYTDPSEGYSNRAGIRMFRNVDESVLDHVNKEDIVAYLKLRNPSAYHALLLEFDK